MSVADGKSYAETFMSDALRRAPAIAPTPELQSYLDGFRARFSFRDVDAYIERARGLRALAVGETIIDEYEYCESIGKAGKEPILAARYVSRERFAGGVLAVANQIAAVSREATVATYLGSRDSHEEFVRSSLRPNVSLEPIYVDDAPTIVKRRFVEIYPFQKLFEIYVMDGHDSARLRAEQEALCSLIEREMPAASAVVVTDYGHGMLRDEAVELLCATAPFLAVNTQMNADNRGFNTISKYRRADFVSLSEHEARLEVRSRYRDIRSVMQEVARRTETKTMVITRGRRGCAVFDRESGYFEIPAFHSDIVDRVGAGDAVLAVGALLASLGAPPEVIGLVANAVGALAVGIVGNASVIERDRLTIELRALLA